MSEYCTKCGKLNDKKLTAKALVGMKPRDICFCDSILTCQCFEAGRKDAAREIFADLDNIVYWGADEYLKYKKVKKRWLGDDKNGCNR